MSLEDEARGVLMKMGLYWPDADSGKLRSAATAWRTFAGAVDDVRGPVNTAALTIIQHNKGEAVDAFEKFWGRYAKGKDAGWLSDLSQSAGKMAEALDKLANATDDAINKLWTQIGIDAAVIAAGVGVAILTAGIASGAAAAAAEAIIELGGTLGIAVTTTVAELAAGALVAAAFGGLESVTVDLAVAQPLKVAAGLRTGFSLDEVNEAAQSGMVFGGALGAGAGVLKAGAEGAFANQSPFLLRPPSLRPDLVDLGSAARRSDDIPCVGEPIDVATGAMLMRQTDLTLPAAGLPLVFERTHLSSYRAGVCFGPSWASTLDEAVQIDGEGVVFAAADGMRLVYSIPRPGEPLLPVTGARWPLEWDGQADGVMTITDPATGVVRTFSTPLPSGAPGTFRLPIDGWHDRNNTRISVERTQQGTPTALRHSGGYYVAIDTHGHRVTALRLLDEAPSEYEMHDSPTAGTGTVVMRYGYDEAGNLTEIINSTGEALRLAYDTEGRITRWTDRNGTWFGYVYDDRGRVVRTQGIDGILSGTLSYDDEARTTTYTDSQGHVSVRRYNAEGLVVEEADPLGRVTYTEWDGYGTRPLAVTDPLGHTTRYTYDAAGNNTGVALPDGTLTQAEYNSLGLVTKVVGPGGALWRHTYDERGNRLTTLDPLGAETRYEYDDSGRPTAITNALGHTRTMILNSAGLPIEITDELGHTTTLRRDVFGRITAATDPLGHTTRTGWTNEGKPSRREFPDGTREMWTWDGEGNLLTHTDPAGNITQHTPGPFDLPAARTDPDGAHYQFAYDTELRLTTVTNPLGDQWTYAYDAAGRLAAESDFNGRSVTYAYDAAGRLTARTTGVTGTLSYLRDSLGRVVEQRTVTDDITTYAYDASGNVVRAANAEAEVVLEYDALGRLLSDSVNGRSMVYAYDSLGQCTHRVTPTGLATEWAYDPVGRLAGLRSEDGALAFTYDAAGRETQCRIGDGVVLTQAWDATDRLTTQTLVSPSSTQHAEDLLQYRSYAYRPDGHVSEIRDLTSGTRSFGLDAIGRATTVRAPGWSETYAYDTTGNLTHATIPGSSEPDKRSYTGTLLRAAGRTAYTHDLQGRLVRKTRKLLNGQTRTWAYDWNAEDRLTTVITPDGQCWHYAYDPLGRRVSKRRVATDGHPAATVDFSWDNNRLAEQTEADGRAVTWAYAPGTHRPLTQTDHWHRARARETSFLTQLAEDTRADRDTRFHATITDLVGTPTELVTADGELAWQYRTALWGTGLPQVADDRTAVKCPLRFPGQYADIETGLNYNHSRYYDPETARYLSPDPLGLEPAPNHHAYVASPLSISDPLGLNPCRIASVTGPAGETLPLPKGATGTPVATGKGWAYDIPSGTKGLDPRVQQVRVMDPVTTGKYQYPNGYVVYMNKAGQSVNPLTGQTVGKADPYNHIPIP
ncbi:DUF6531 domain-containing protein [Streptomyces sp. NPDC050560]|uniref:DUF6531 domain-containing protein n=1 Tax=Streptomyces sp. NPDC050560 TaxID=3365630 RepID=UPI0037B13A60